MGMRTTPSGSSTRAIEKRSSETNALGERGVFRNHQTLVTGASERNTASFGCRFSPCHYSNVWAGAPIMADQNQIIESICSQIRVCSLDLLGLGVCGRDTTVATRTLPGIGNNG